MDTREHAPGEEMQLRAHLIAIFGDVRVQDGLAEAARARVHEEEEALGVESQRGKPLCVDDLLDLHGA